MLKIKKRGKLRGKRAKPKPNHATFPLFHGGGAWKSGKVTPRFIHLPKIDV